MSLFSTELQKWYVKNHRDLPWRNTRNPYFIWLSEVILQQTRVQQGMSYYYKFVEHYPDVNDFAQADENEILNLWQGLGYYSRARNMHKTAQFVVAHHHGVFPKSYDDLLKLPGVGKYTAAALASFAFDLPHAVVDGNVYRVLSRYFNAEEFIDTGAGQKFYQSLADELLDKQNPARHNQAIMELGALICTPKNPSCANCPLTDSCEGRAKNTWNNLPRKKGKVKVKNRTLNYFVCVDDDFVLMKKRGDKDIWANMFEFPLIEGDDLPEPLTNEVELTKTLNHKLTHQNLTVNFYSTKFNNSQEAFSNTEKIAIDELKNYPLPRVIERFLEEEMKLFVRI